MKQANLKNLIILLALVLTLAACQKSKEKVGGESGNEETTIEGETNNEKTGNEEVEINDGDKKILTDLINLFEKFNPNIDNKQYSFSITEPFEVSETELNLVPDGVTVRNSISGDGKYGIDYVTTIEENESAFENFVKQYAAVLKKIYNIDEKDFSNKAMEEYKNLAEVGYGIFDYQVDQKNGIPMHATLGWERREDKFKLTGIIPDVESDKEYNEALTELAYKYLNEDINIVDKDLLYYFHQASNNMDDMSAYGMDLNPNMTPEEIEKSIEKGIEKGQQHFMENNIGTSHNVTTLPKEELGGKAKDEVYQTTITVFAKYSQDIDEILKVFDEATSKVPDEIKNRSSEMKNLIKKQHETKMNDKYSMIPDLTGKEFIFITKSDIVEENGEMNVTLQFFTDGRGDLVELIKTEDSGNTENKNQ